MAQQPPDESQFYNQPQWRQSPQGSTQGQFQQATWNYTQQPSFSANNQPPGYQPTQQAASSPDQQDFGPSFWEHEPAPAQPSQPGWGQQPSQHLQQSTPWFAQQTQVNMPPQPWAPSQPPTPPPTPPRRTLWQRYRRSRTAQILSGLLLIALLASLVLTIFHPIPGLPGPFGNGGFGGNGNNNTGPADFTVDFQNRSLHTYPIPSTFLGVGGLGITNVINVAAPYLPQASMRLTRFGDFMPDVFANPASATNPALQNWSKFDQIMSIIRDNHLVPIMILTYSPTWLQPQNQNPAQVNYCLTNPQKSDPSHVKPTFIVNGQDVGPQKWGQLAAQVVAHVDKTFPSVKPLYEIWNEPDGLTYWCMKHGDPNANHERLTEYKQLYAAAAPLMKQQAQQDGTQIKIGGPALAFVSARATLWITSLVSDPATAPYIDFISYHQYSDAKSWQALVSKTQDSKVGYIAEYQLIASIVHSGQQPNAQSTPIYIDEYNGNSCAPKVCRNDPTYAPLWNSLFVTDLLDTVAIQVSDKGLAAAVPSGTVYFTWSAPPGKFCMFGQVDANLDCAATSSAQAYPQYYAYKLVGGPDYLNITDNGYAVSSVSTDKKGVFIAGFFTQGHDSILLVNTTDQTFSNVNVLAQNPGESVATGKLYILNKDNPHIGTQSINLQQGNNGLSATITIPAYSTVGISI
ncbi:MAG TPA: hypothetical protein VFA41_10450 [Ktedonobacteraceae bacterium]|jgi:hypothetical protein|nr:hypothetical protein [Ktedonobacteraceae bacterium]